MEHPDPTHDEPATENVKERPLPTRFGRDKRRVEARMQSDTSEPDRAATTDDDALFEDDRGL